MKVGIVGRRGSGKTTVFQALTGLLNETTGFDEKRRTRIGQIKVPDPRLDFLAEIYASQRKVQVELDLVDFAPLLSTKTTESTIDRSLLPALRDLEALLIVIPTFDKSFEHPEGAIDAIETELILADIEQVERRLQRIKKESRVNDFELVTLEKCAEWLNAGRPLRTLELKAQELKAIQQFCFLSLKPALGVVNYQAQALGNSVSEAVFVNARVRGLELFSIDALLEKELWELEPDQRRELLKEAGLAAPGRERIVRALYQSLNLITFYTAGPKESRAWALRRGSTALEAAGKIHTDMARGFIRAEVIAFSDLERFGSENGAKSAGKLRLESRDYVVQDGDILRIRFKV